MHRLLKHKKFLVFENGLRPRLVMGLCVVSLSLIGCNQIERPKVEPFYAVTAPPPLQELKWSNGKSPVSSDPARAAAPPETDLVRAIYEGLTDLDSRSLNAVPAAASRWESSKDLRKWTFHLRRDAKWTNGEPVTAHDFVRSWRRLIDLGERTANNHLFQNIVGMNTWSTPVESRGRGSQDFLPFQSPGSDSRRPRTNSNSSLSPDSQPSTVPEPLSTQPVEEKPVATSAERKFGAVAVDDHTLQVEIAVPDKDFPRLVANPVFRPVYGDGANFESSPLDPGSPTNGAFGIGSVDEGSIVLERAETYWNRKSVALAQVRLIAAETAESALEAYKKGEVDVVTNAAFEPLAIKLLTPFDDFRRTAHNALNFYEVNTDRPPFNDRRVRQALALSIDREKLADGDLRGTTQPAYSFSPLLPKRTESLTYDTRKANDLLERAGYPDGVGFPPIRLVINRNDVQQRVAASVARMWKQNLNLDSEIIVKEASEIDEVRRTGDFDLLRRGVTLPTNNMLVNLMAVQGPFPDRPAIVMKNRVAIGDPPPTEPEELPYAEDKEITLLPDTLDEIEGVLELPDGIDEALFEMTTIPLYFPMSYSLIKPYILGFELNGLDAPSLKDVSIDNAWQPEKAQRES